MITPRVGFLILSTRLNPPKFILDEGLGESEGDRKHPLGVNLPNLEERDFVGFAISQISRATGLRIWKSLENRFFLRNRIDHCGSSIKPSLALYRLMNLSLKWVGLVGSLVGLVGFTTVFGIPDPEMAIAQVAQTPETPIIEAVYLNQQAYDLFQRGDRQSALATYNRALAIFRQFQAKGGEVSSLNGIGEVYLALQEPDQALKFFQQALNLIQEMSKASNTPLVEEAYTLQWIGSSYEQKAQFDRALVVLSQAQKIFQNLSNSNSSSDLNNSLKLVLTHQGSVSFKLGKYLQALEFYQKSLPLYRQGSDKIGEAQTLNNIGVIYAHLNQYQNALNSYEQALAIVRTLCCYRGDEAAILNNLSSLYFSLNQPEQALDFAQKATVIYQHLQGQQDTELEPRKIELLEDTLGQVSFDPLWLQQNLAKPAALNNLGDVTVIFKSGEAVNFNNFGFIYLRQNNYEQAKIFFEKALSTYQDLGNTWGQALTLNNLGQAYSGLSKFDQAVRFNQQALSLYEKLNDPVGIGVTWSNLAKIYYQQKEYPKAREFFQKAVTVQSQIGDKAGTGTNLIYLGEISLKLNQIPDAIAHFNQAIERLETLRPGLKDAYKISLFETQALAYRLLQKSLISQNQIQPALEVAERSRARAFVELLASRIGSQNSTDTQLAPPTIQRLQQVAKTQQSTLVEYSIISDLTTESSLYIWVIKPTGEIHFRQVNLQPLFQSLDSQESPLRSVTEFTLKSRSIVLNRRGKGQTNQQLNQLYNLLIKPIAEFLPNDGRSPVIFIPQGPLFLVPFAALRDDSGQYLIARHPIAIAPAIEVLDLTHKQRQNQAQTTPKSALIVGNPVMPKLTPELGKTSIELTALPGAEVEAKTISQLLESPSLIGDQATETQIKNSIAQAEIIHLATHGLLDEFKSMDWGIPGAIALTPDSQNDGFLTSSEIMDLRLNASFVVLSACNTGRGRLTSDGIIGLSRAFITAGVPSIITSLWAIPDLPTAELMSEFYRQLQHNPNRSQALQQAMLKTMLQYPQPMDWGGFVLMGEAL